MKSERSLTQGSIVKGMLAFALPVFIGQLFQQLYNTADALIVGQFLSDEAYAAVTSSGSLVFLLIGFFSGIAAGAGVVIGRYFGAREYERLKVAIQTTFIAALIAGVLMTAIGVFLTPQILRLMDTPETVFDYAVEYFRYYSFGMIGIVLYNFMNGVLQALGDSRHPLYYLIAASILNIILDYLFIGVFHWGVWSAALATSLSQVFSAVLCTGKLMRLNADYRLRPQKARMELPMLSEIVRNGIPAGFQNSIIAFANLVVQSNINSFGELAVAGSGTYSKLEGFAFLPINSFIIALTTFVSQNIGARRLDRVKKGAWFGIGCCAVLSEVIGALLWIFADPLMRLFTDNPESLAICTEQIHIEVLFYCMLACTHSIAAILRGAGWPFAPMTVMLVCWCVIRVTYISIMVPLIGDIRVVYSAYPLTWTLSTIVFGILFFKTDWIHTYERQKNRKKISNGR